MNSHQRRLERRQVERLVFNSMRTNGQPLQGIVVGKRLKGGWFPYSGTVKNYQMNGYIKLGKQKVKHRIPAAGITLGTFRFAPKSNYYEIDDVTVTEVGGTGE